MSEKRQADRLQSQNLSYILLNEAGEIIHQGMGRTLNLSTKGVFLETAFPIEPGYTVIITLGLADETTEEVRTKVAHQRKLPSGRVGTGLTFIDISESALEIVKNYMKLYPQSASDAIE